MTAPRALYRIGFTNWLMAKPWKIYPLWRSGWRYHILWDSIKRTRRNFLLRLWWTISFPHVHDPDEDEQKF